jgi:hypothetical protein
MTYTGVTMQTGSAYRCLTIPLAAMADSAHDKVYVVDDEGIMHLKTVEAGADDGTYIEIYAGLSEGEAVVTGSMEGLSEGMKAELNLEGEKS